MHLEFLYRLYPYISSIGTVSEFYYYYIQRDGAITYTFDRRLFNYIDNWNGIIKFYKDNKLYNKYKKELEYCYVRYLYATFIKRAINFDKKEYKEAVSVAKKNIKNNFPNYRKNSYFYKSIKGIYLLFFNESLSKIYYKLKHRNKKPSKIPLCIFLSIIVSCILKAFP